MGFLERFRRSTEHLPDVREDVTLGHSGARSVQSFARSGDWREVRKRLISERDPMVRTLMVNACSELPNTDQWVTAWMSAYPDEANLWLLAGARSIARGWEIRGGGWAKDVAEERWDAFHECIDNAEEELARAAELAPNDPLPWPHLLTTAVALSAPVEERIARFEMGYSADRNYLPNAAAFINSLTEKWGGSHELMFTHARAIAGQASTGSAVPLVVVQAHIEKWFYLRSWEKDARATKYFDDKDVRKEIADIYKRCEQPPDGARIQTANTFAFVFSLQGDRKAAANEYRKAGGLYYGHPFYFFGAEVYRKWRDAALKA